MDASLLDTDTLSEILRRRNDAITQRAAIYLTHHAEFSFSSITHYEIVRGLLHKGATRQLAAYRTFALKSAVLPITNEILERAAELWVEGRRTGRPHVDADLIIAATAIIHNRTLVTGNVPHFDWISGLAVDNWRQS